MRRITTAVALSLLFASAAHAQTTRVSISSTDFVVTPAFNNVPLFSFEIEINAPLAAGVYDDPAIVSVFYTVQGNLANTPSGFPAFALERDISGTEFYAQGSSLSFEISPNAVLDDGVQVAELVGADIVFTFNGREIDNGRFHPALFELRADGTGRIQNSNNIVTQDPLLQVDFGDEYITDLAFDPGNLTLMTAINPPPPPPPGGFSRGGGSVSLAMLAGLLLIAIAVAASRRRSRVSVRSM
ncbi:MAG: hypothetical protein QNJ00_09805 [Woeseiaceae bacterium]|nr:hypothetical protein [Woeseiaceae bacterium]